MDRLLSGLLTVPRIVGLFMLVYAVAITLQPDRGIIGWVQINYPLMVYFFDIAFTLSGLICLFLPRISSWLFSLLVIPLLLYAIAGVLWFLNVDNASATGFIGHAALSLVSMRWAYDQTKVYRDGLY